MTFIPIDRTSIRRNKHAGQTNFDIPGRTRIIRHVIADGFYRKYVNDQEVQWCTHDGPSREWTEHELDVEEISLMRPVPTWSYSYVPTEVQCRECGAKFPHTELDEDDFGGDNLIKHICPKCGEGDCCDIEYEKIDDALKQFTPPRL